MSSSRRFKYEKCGSEMDARKLWSDNFWWMWKIFGILKEKKLKIDDKFLKSFISGKKSKIDHNLQR